VTTAIGALAECIETYRRWLHMPDPGALLMALATVAANRAEGDPVWLLVIGPPGGGKTELLVPLHGLPDVYKAATMTEAALLSGTPRKEKAANAKGGLLREIGAFGIIVMKDFGSVLSMHTDSRAAVLAALREIYDGSWTRHLGTDGGQTLSWEGKVGLVAGCTPAIDNHHAVIGSMGERFLLYRLPGIDADKQAGAALAHVGRERAMRTELAAAVKAVLASVAVDELTAAPGDVDRDRLVAISTLAVRCRSAVERDSYRREIQLIPDSEAPARVALVLLKMLNALRAIGVDELTTWRLVIKAALDSMPAIRRTALDALRGQAPSALSAVADRTGYPTTTTRRALEDLTAHGVLECTRPAKADLWALSDWASERWLRLEAIFSEKPQDVSNPSL